jgi:thioredoxin-like negative regulator of GroEL
MEKDLSFLKGDLSSLAHDAPNLKFVKKLLQVGMYKQAERILSLMQLEDPENSTINFYLAKVYFAINRYEDSQSCYLLVKPESKKFQKSITNRAFVINMSGNFMQALQLIRQVDTSQLSDIAVMKHQLKLSSVLKRGSCYP